MHNDDKTTAIVPVYTMPTNLCNNISYQFAFVNRAKIAVAAVSFAYLIIPFLVFLNFPLILLSNYEATKRFSSFLNVSW